VATPNVVRIGITDYAQDSLGDIVFVQLPDVGTAVASGDSIGEVESTKSVSDIYAPVSGTVTAKNDGLDGEPELINSDPYGGGWMLEIELNDASSIEELLSADDYQELTDKA
jgi:glycine cleavage system H protein